MSDFTPPQPEFTSMEKLRSRLLKDATMYEVHALQWAVIEAADQVGVNSPTYEALVEELFHNRVGTAVNWPENRRGEL